MVICIQRKHNNVNENLKIAEATLATLIREKHPTNNEKHRIREQKRRNYDRKIAKNR
jgi:hypothetical protein